MTSDTKKKLAEMGNITDSKEKLRILIEEAKKNPNDPHSVELRRRLERGMFNKELEALGKKPFPVQMPKIDMKAAMAGVKQEEGVQSVVPGKTGIMETVEDVGQTIMGIGGALRKGAEEAGGIMRDQDFTVAQKGFGVLGAGAGAISDAFGEAVVGAGKQLLSQESENKIKEIVSQAGKTVSETQAMRMASDWYDGLNKDEKLIIDSAGGMLSFMTDLFTAGGAKVGAQAIKEGLDTTTDVIKQGAPVVARQVDELFRPTEAKLESKIDTLFTKAVRPTVQGKQNIGQMEKAREQAVEAVRTINANAPELKFTDELGQVVEGRAPESLREFSQSIEQTKANIYKQYNDLAKQTGDAGVKINPVEFTDEFDAFINNKSVQVASPETVEYAKMMRDRYGNAGELSPEDVENIIKIYNQDLQTFYKNPTAEQGRKVAVDAMIVNNLRKQLDEVIENTTGGNYQKLKNQYGALRSIEKDVLNATLRDARKNTAGLIDYTDILTGGDLVTGVLSMNPAILGGAVAQRGIKSYFKYLNDPNTNVKKMFQTAETLQSRFPEQVTNPATRETLQLPPGQTDVPTTYGNTPIEVGGTDPLGRPIQPGGTERVAPGATINRTDSEPNVPPVKEIQDATDEATSQVETEMTELSKAGRRLPVLDQYGSIVGFKAEPSTFPEWVPKNLRTTDLFTRVWNNINAGRPPRANATNEMELQRILEAKIKERADQILSNPKKDAGIFDNNVPFALALMAGGTYYYFSEDGSALPLVAIGMMSPAARKGAIKQLDDMIADARKAANSPDATPAQRRAYEKTVNQLTKQKANIIEEANQPK